MFSLTQNTFAFETNLAAETSATFETNLADEISETLLKVMLWRNLQKLCNCRFFTRQVEKNEQKLRCLNKRQTPPPVPNDNIKATPDLLMPYVVTIQNLSPDIFDNDYDWL